MRKTSDKTAASPDIAPVNSDVVRDDFNDLRAVVHYTRAAHKLGLWASEKIVFDRFLPAAADTRILEAGCGAGRVSIALHALGRRQLVAFDFAEALLEQAEALSVERTDDSIRLFHADARRVASHPVIVDELAQRGPFDAVLFMFNGLMQIPRRRQRRRALRQLAQVCKPGAPLIFTTHDREHSATERALWRLEAQRWATGKQDPQLAEFGDRYFEDDLGRTFMHLPDRAEILADLKATGWTHHWDSLRRDICAETRAVRDFSDECRFWVSHRT